MKEMTNAEKPQEATRIIQSAGIKIEEVGTGIKEAMSKTSQSINDLQKTHSISQLPKNKYKYHK